MAEPSGGHPIAALIDHTLLRADAVRGDIVPFCQEARTYGFAAVCVNQFWVALAASELAGSPVKVCTVVGFPLGATLCESKIAEAEVSVLAGAAEIDMVQNIGALLSGNIEAVRSEIRQVGELVHNSGAILKVILETALLDDEQKREVCRIAAGEGADFVKTSTGFAKAGATVHDVQLMRAAVGPGCGVKASGGIRNLADCQAMLAAGANRIGASAGVAIVRSAEIEAAAKH